MNRISSHSVIGIVLTLFFVFSTFLLSAKTASALTCTGSGGMCCLSWTTTWTPSGCDPSDCSSGDDPYCVPCDDVNYECTDSKDAVCSPIGGRCESFCNGSHDGGWNCRQPAPTDAPILECNPAISWTAWGGCTVACGGGTSTRYNTCSGVSQSVTCNTQECPPNCLTNPDAFWTGWSGSGSCGTYTQTRTNTCTNATQTRPVDTGVPCCDWGGWTNCSTNCGTGTQIRVDSCNNYEQRSCTDHSNCPNCDPNNPSNQGAWSACDNACNGIQTRLVCGNTETRACNVSATCGNVTGVQEQLDCSSFVLDQYGSMLGITATAKASKVDYQIPNPSFEEGHYNFWSNPKYLSLLNVFDCTTNPAFSCAHGSWFLAMKRDPVNYALEPPYVTSAWFDAGLGDLSGKTFRLKFMARGEFINYSIPFLGVQTRPEGDDWTNGTSVYAWMPDVNVLPGVWQTYEYDLTFPAAAAGHSTSEMRIVLRPPWNDYTAYFDAIELKNVSVVQSLKMYITPFQSGAGANYCTPGIWTEIPGVLPPWIEDYWSAGYDVSSLTPGGKYYIVANVTDSNGMRCTGNPSGTCGSPNQDYSCFGCKQLYTACLPSCTPACGQLDGCGANSYCPNTDGGVPTTPTIVSPTNNQKVEPVANLYTVSWSDADTKVDSYEYVIFSRDVYGTNADTALAAATAGSPDAITAIKVGSNGTYSENITPTPTVGTRLTLAVRAYNSTCTGPAQISPWRMVNFDLVGNVVGNYIDDTTLGICSSTDQVSLPADAGNLVWLERSGSPDGAAAVSGTGYVLQTEFNPSSLWDIINGGALSVKLQIHNTDLTNAYICSSCPSPAQTNTCNADFTYCTCTRSGSITTGATPTNFYLRKFNLANDPWWQTWGGLVFANGTMNSQGPTANIPSSCVPHAQCDPSIIQTSSGPAGAPDPNFNDTAGVPIVTGANALIGGNGVGGYYSNRTGNARVTAGSAATGHSQASARVENYAYFASTTALAVPQNSDGSTTTISQLSELTAQTLTTGPGEVGYTVPGNLVINLDKDTKWNIAAGTKAVIFVPGNLTLTATDANPNTAAEMQGLIKVASGGFLSFIVKGNIVVSSSLGYNGDKNTIAGFQTPILEGIYIATGSLTIQSFGGSSPIDNKFVGAGTFVGFGGVDLQRDFSDGGTGTRKELHNTSPTETFIFRPDFVVNAPNVLRKPVIQWKEINT